MHYNKLFTAVCIAAVSTIILTGCGTRSGARGYTSAVPDEMQKRIDTRWQDGIYAIGSATGPNENIASSKATANARAEVARQFQAQIDVLEKGYIEAVNEHAVEEYSQVLNTFASIEITGSKQDMILTKQEGDQWSAKVLLVISAEQFKASIDDKLNAYTSFKAQEAYSELEQRVEQERQRLEQAGN